MLDGVPERTCIVPFEARDQVVRETDVASVGITIADDDVNDPLFDTVHALTIHVVRLRSALFTHRMSHCVSGPQLEVRSPKRCFRREMQSLAVFDDKIGNGLAAADLAGRLRRP